MTTLAERITTARSEVAWDGPLIDADVHAGLADLDVLRPHLSPLWRDFLDERGYDAPPSLATTYPPNAPGSCRPEWRVDGVTAASDLSLLQAQSLDAFGTERAVLTCQAGIDSVRHPDLAAALARAVNDWLITDWLDRDDRLRASLVVPTHTVADAVAEVERVGDHPGFVQVLMPARAPQLYGRRNWHPLLGAIAERDLAVGLHFGGTGDGAPSPCGWPSWYVEEYVAEQQVFISQLVSLIVEGAFQQFPALRVAVLEAGFTWLPSLLWRFDKEWKGLRRTTPWLTRAPSEIVRDHFRFATAPIEARTSAQLVDILEWIGPDLLMFSSDYPHHHDDDLSVLLGALDPADRGRVMAENARAFYRLP